MQKKNPRVLLISVTYDGKDYCFDDFLKQVKSLTYPDISILFCDNSLNSGYYNKLNNIKGNVTAIRVNPNGKTVAQALAESYEACRQFAIRCNFDYIFLLESDIFLPTHSAIERLMDHRKLVCSGIYPVGHGKASYFLLQQNVGQAGHDVMINDLKNGSDLMFIDGTVKEIFACGNGCTLIKKDIFTKIPFRYVSGQNYFQDTYFYMDLFSMGVRNFCDTGLICSHRNQVWEKEQALTLKAND